MYSLQRNCFFQETKFSGADWDAAKRKLAKANDDVTRLKAEIDAEIDAVRSTQEELDRADAAPPAKRGRRSTAHASLEEDLNSATQRFDDSDEDEI